MTVLFLVICLVSVICVGLLLFGLYQKNTNAICKSKRRLDGKSAIVTGGTSGMGLEVAKDLASRGAKVIVACPFQEEGLIARELIIRSSRNENVIFEHLDLSSFASVRSFANKIMESEDRVDILVNNAGLAGYLSDRLTADGLNLVMQVNYFGAVLLTLLLLPLLKKTGHPKEPSRIVNTSSLSHHIGKLGFEFWENPGGPFVTYASSKLCIALFTRELAKRLNSCNVIVNVVDPGVASTPIFKDCGILASTFKFLINVCLKSAWEGAQTAVHAAVDEDAALNGKYFCNCQVASPRRAPTSYDDDERCRLLWDKTMELIKFENKCT